MPIYSPYNSTENYYNPYEQTQQDAGPGIGKLVFDAAKGMAVFGLLHGASKIAGRYLSTRATTFIKDYGKGRVAELARSTGATTVKDIFKATSSGKALNNFYSDATNSFRTALNAKDQFVSTIARTSGPSAARIAGFKSTFKDFRTFAGSVGRLWKNTVWTGAGVAYALDSFAGFGQGYGIERKSLFDIPGQVSNFGKWLALNSVFSMGFGAAGKFAKLAGAVGVSGLQQVFKGPLGQSTSDFLTRNVRMGMPKGLNQGSNSIFNKQVIDYQSNYTQHFVTKAIRGMVTFGRTVPGAMTALNTMVRDSAENTKEAFKSEQRIGRALKRAAADPVTKALKQIGDIWRQAKENRSVISPVYHTGLNALQFADEMAAKIATQPKGAGNKAVTGILQEYTSQFRALRNQKGNNVLTDHVLKDFSVVRNKDVVNMDWARRIHGTLAERSSKRVADRFMASLLNMQSGVHMYKPKGKDIRGGGVDLSFADPLYQARKLMNFALDRNLAVPFTDITLNFADLFQTHLFAGKSPNFDFWREKKSFDIGKNARGKNFELKKGTVSTSEIEDDVWFTTYNEATRSFSMVGPSGIKTVESSNRLIALAPGNTYKQRQEEKMQQELWRAAGQQMAPKDGQLRKYTGNKYVDYFIDKSQLEFPGVVQRLGRRVIGAIRGRNHEYIDAGHTAFTSNPADWYRQGDIIASLKEHLGQDLLPLFRNKEFNTMLGNLSHSSQFGDTYDLMFNSRTLRQKMADLEYVHMGTDNWAKWLNKRGIAEEVALIKARPEYAEKHIVTKRLGKLNELTAYDKVRIAVMEDRIAATSAFLDDKRLDDFVRQGLMTKQQAKKLGLFARVTQFTETGMYDRRHFGNPVPEMIEAGKAVADRAQKLNWEMGARVAEYVSSKDMRRSLTREMNLQGLSTTKYLSNNTPYVAVARDPGSFLASYGDNVFNNVTDMLHDTMFPFRKDPAKTLNMAGNAKYLMGGAAKIAGTIFAFKALDAFIAANPLFDQTAFEAGLGGFLADNVARVRLGQSRVFDALGVTGVAKHLEGLLPGFTTSAPGAIIGGVVSRTLGGGPLGIMKGFGIGAIGNRLLSPYLPDFTKSYEQLEDEYQGKVEVPIMKSPTWLLGATPWEGSKVIGYQPNWYIRAKSRWQETDTLYGSTLRKLIHEPLPLLGINIGDFIDPYYMERKHFFSRPYPETGEWGSEIPLIGPLIAGTLGRIFKPKKTMHQEFLTGPADLTEDSPYPFAIQPPTVQEGRGMMYHSMGLRKIGGRSSLMGNFVYGGDSKMWAHSAGEDFLERVQNFTGLPGFIAGTVKDKLVETPRVLPTLETAGRMASMGRAYFDMNLGGMGVFTEPVRRLIDKPDYKRYGINPIPNMMPNWLPAEFLTGDPYQKIMKGELRLPGKAYQVTHKIKRSMPARASMLGAPEDHMVQYFTGLISPLLKEEYDILATGTTTHERIQDSLAAEGLLIQAEAVVQDVKNDITGHVDAIIRDGKGGRGRRALEIKTIGQEAFNKLDAPKDQHVGQLNFYLKQLKMREGVIMYVSRDNPSQVKTFNLKYSESRWQKDLRKLQKSRQVTADLMKEGMDDQFGYSYSWLDRLNILADIAPTSPEYKEAKFFVENQMKYGLLTEDDIARYRRALNHRQARIRKYELYPNRFRGKVFSPDTQKNIQSINEDIKAAADYTLPERIVGSIWERFTNSNNFISNKFFAFKDPLEHYKMLRLYGKEYKPWDEVYGSFVEPTMRSMLAQTGTLGGAYKWALPAYVLSGGPAGALLGGIVGAGYGTIHGMYRGITGSAYIPSAVEEQRNIESYFDMAKYERNQRAASLSRGISRQEYIDASNATLTAFNQTGQDIANLFRGTPFMEKPYIEAWLNVKNEKERREILKYIPKDLAKALKKQWSTSDGATANAEYNQASSEYIASGGRKPAFDRSILDPSVQLEDIKLKTVEEAGFNAHDFGLGWNQQLYRLMDNYDNIQAANTENTRMDLPTNINAGQVRQSVMELLISRGFRGNAQVYINNNVDDVNVVNITIRRDRALTVKRALDYRNRYYGQ